MADSAPSELDQLRRENARLIALLEAHGVAWRSSGPAPSPQALASDEITGSVPRSAQEKVALFRRLFRGSATTPVLSCDPAGNSWCRQRWRSRAPARAPMCGCSSRRPYRRGRIDWLDLGHPVLQRMWERRLVS